MSEEKFRGAESKLFVGKWLDKPAIYKKRLPKKYRIPELDFYFRKQRTIHEGRLLSKAKIAGVRTPFIYDIDIDNTTLTMELIDGEILKYALPKMDFIQQKDICKKIGVEIGKLHKAGIIHGDLTTSNIIFLANQEIVFIDFGLGFISDRIEDIGIDLYLLERAFISTHPDIFENLWEAIIEGYKLTSPFGEDIDNKIKEISSRGRYSERM
ncbi:MAG: KEOPS complex kinase/ATPase Bud32 [Candidatus Thorarchaeota archaeon]